MQSLGFLQVLVLFCAGNAALAQSVTFESQPPAAGSGAKVSATSTLTISGDDGGTVTTNLDKAVTILTIQSDRVTQAKVHYNANHKTSTIPRVEGERSPTEGRGYLAFADGTVTTPSGGEVSRAERKAVAEDMKVGEPDPLASALDGKTLTVGATLPAGALIAMFDGGPASAGLGEIEHAVARLIDVREQGPTQLAVFEVEVATKMKRGLRAETTIDLTGEMIIAAPAGVTVSLELSGPVEVTSQKGIRPLRRARTMEETRGTFAFTMRVTPTQPSQDSEMVARSGVPTPAAEQPTVASIVGKWQTDQLGNFVEVYAENDAYQGKLTESSNPAAPLGTLIIRDCVQIDTRYSGKLYSPMNDRAVDADFVIKDDTMTIDIKAGQRSRKIVWTRVE